MPSRYALGDISSTRVISVPEEDTRVARLKLGRNGFLIQRPPLWAPVVRPWDHYRSPVGRRSLGQRGHATDHHWQLLIMGMIVTASRSAYSNIAARAMARTYLSSRCKTCRLPPGFTRKPTVEEMMGLPLTVFWWSPLQMVCDEETSMFATSV